MTPSEWKRVEDSLAFPHGKATLRCDGRDVAAVVQMTKPLRYAVVVYVDGHWKGEWLRADRPCDEQRFMNPHERAYYSAADLKLYRRAYSAKQMREMTDKKHRWFSPDFPTAKAFRRRIVSQCKCLELVSCTQDEIDSIHAKQRALVEEAL